MRFLLVIPRFAPPGHAYDFPLGIAYVGEVLELLEILVGVPPR